jgi:hypothetical protein
MNIRDDSCRGVHAWHGYAHITWQLHQQQQIIHPIHHKHGIANVMSQAMECTLYFNRSTIVLMKLIFGGYII